MTEPSKTPPATPEHPTSSRKPSALVLAILAGLLITFACLRYDHINLTDRMKATEAKLDMLSRHLVAIANRQDEILAALEHNSLGAEVVRSAEKAVGELNSIDSAINSFMAEVEMAYGADGGDETDPAADDTSAGEQAGVEEPTTEQPE